MPGHAIRPEVNVRVLEWLGVDRSAIFPIEAPRAVQVESSRIPRTQGAPKGKVRFVVTNMGSRSSTDSLRSEDGKACGYLLKGRKRTRAATSVRLVDVPPGQARTLNRTLEGRGTTPSSGIHRGTTRPVSSRTSVRPVGGRPTARLAVRDLFGGRPPGVRASVSRLRLWRRRDSAQGVRVKGSPHTPTQRLEGDGGRLACARVRAREERRDSGDAPPAIEPQLDDHREGLGCRPCLATVLAWARESGGRPTPAQPPRT